MQFRDRLDVEALLKAIGIVYEKRGYNLTAKCPNPGHVDTNPSWTIVDRPGHWKHAGHRCFACGFAGGPWELVMAVRGVDEETAAEIVGSLVTGAARWFEGVPRVRVVMPSTQSRPEYELPSEVCIPTIDGSPWPVPFSDYLTRRGVTSEQIVRWNMGFATRGDLAWRVVIPVHTRGRLVGHVARAIFDDRERYDVPRSTARGARPTAALLGEPLIDSSLGVITLAEGSFSMLALERADAPNPMALLGSDWSLDRATVLSAFDWDHVIIATDPDEAGDRAARAIAMSFRRSRISRLRMDKSPDDCELDDLRSELCRLRVQTARSIAPTPRAKIPTTW